MKKKKKKPYAIKPTRETQEERRTRVSSGVRYRAVIIQDKKRKLQDDAEHDEI